MSNGFTVVVEVVAGAGWSLDGAVDEVEVADGESAYDAARAWWDEFEPPEGEWRLLVRPAAGGEPVVVGRASLECEPGGGARTPRAGKARMPWRTRARHSHAVRGKRTLLSVDPGQRILVTRDRRNTTALRLVQPLYPAATPEGAVPALVKIKAAGLDRNGRLTPITVTTDLGEIRDLDPGQPVILAA